MLKVIELKSFIPSHQFDESLSFYQEIGFVLRSNQNGIAYLNFEQVSFLLQKTTNSTWAQNYMMHLLVEDLELWWNHLLKSKVATKYHTQLIPPQIQPWNMIDFCFIDPSGVLWRVGQNVN